MSNKTLMGGLLAVALAVVPLGLTSTAASAHPRGPDRCWAWKHHHWVWVCKRHHYVPMYQYDPYYYEPFYAPYYYGPSFGFFFGGGGFHHHHHHNNWNWKKH